MHIVHSFERGWCFHFWERSLKNRDDVHMVITEKPATLLYYVEWFGIGILCLCEFVCVYGLGAVNKNVILLGR